jgi:putative oxidoreductase
VVCIYDLGVEKMKNSFVPNYWKWMPEFSWSHFLLRIPLAIVFISQGLTLLPFDSTEGQKIGVGAASWWIMSYGELLAGIGLLVGGLASLPIFRHLPMIDELGDSITRFSGITICCITTGIIWIISKPPSLLDVILYDNFHLFLWVGGLYFALRGNFAGAVTKTQTQNNPKSDISEPI